MKKQLDFPISVAAVRLHGREFHEQDFFVPYSVTSEHLDGSASRAATGPADPSGPAPGRASLLGESARKLARWTLTCVGLALVVVLVLSWLVRPDQEPAKWVDTSAHKTTAKAR